MSGGELLAGLAVLLGTLAWLQWTARGKRSRYTVSDSFSSVVSERLADTGYRVHWTVTRDDGARLLQVQLRIPSRVQDVITNYELESLHQEGYGYADGTAEEPHVTLLDAGRQEENGDQLWTWRTGRMYELEQREEARNRWG